MATIKKPKVFALVGLNFDGAMVKVHWSDNGIPTMRDPKSPMHPDMQALVKTAKRLLVKYYDMDDSQVDNVNIGSIKVNKYADDEGQSVQINGTFTHPEGEQNTPLKTAKIQTHNDLYGFEGELKALVSNLSNEASAYVFDAKSAQLSIDVEEPEEVEQEEPVY